MKKKMGILLVMLLALFSLSACSNEEKEKETEEFNQTVEIVETNNQSLQTAISDLQALVDSEIPPLDETTLETANEAITEAESRIVEIPEIPSKLEEIQASTEELKAKTDCSEIMETLSSANEALSNSIRQMEQVTNPTEDFVIERLTGLPNVVEMAAVTEDNDPNGNLSKAGGYTACVYFSSDLVNQDEVYGDTVIDKGTDGGGAVEVYSSVEDANTRNDYLASFDGAGFLASGSHSVVGTVVIRTSDNLTATQQKEMEANIYNSLVELR